MKFLFLKKPSRFPCDLYPSPVTLCLCLCWGLFMMDKASHHMCSPLAEMINYFQLWYCQRFFSPSAKEKNVSSMYQRTLFTTTFLSLHFKPGRVGYRIGSFKLPLEDETRSSFQLFRTLENEKECRKLPDQLISDSCSKYTENSSYKSSWLFAPPFFF